MQKNAIPTALLQAVFANVNTRILDRNSIYKLCLKQHPQNLFHFRVIFIAPVQLKRYTFEAMQMRI